jgi:hypothetical protein
MLERGRLLPQRGAREAVDVAHAVELRLFVEQRLDPILAVPLAPKILDPLFLLLRVPRDLLRERARAEQRRPMQLVHVPRRRRRAARLHDRPERLAHKTTDAERADDVFRELRQRS